MTFGADGASPVARRVWPLLAVLLARGAFAGGAAELWAPPEPVPPDGFAVFLTAGGELAADGAAISRHGRPGEFWVVPRADAAEVVVRSQGLSRRLRVGPPSTSVRLTLTPVAPVKGRDRDATLEIDVLGSDGKVDPESAAPVLRANVGSLEGMERLSPGRYRARFVLPPTRYPEVAIIVAFAAWPHPQSIHGAFGSLRVPLATSVEVPGRTEAGAETRMTIAGKSFGPVRAGADGAFRLPVIVPPGYGRAQGTTVDRIGNRRTTAVDLMLPPTDQLSCVVTPTRLPADGAAKARVLCAASDQFGGPALAAPVKLKARRGAVGEARDLGNGIREWTWTAPSDRGEGVELLSATWKQGAVDSRDELRVELVQGAVARVEALSRGDGVVHLDSSATLELRALDSLGRPVPGVHLDGQLPSGTVDATPSDDAGVLRVRWDVAHAAEPGPASLALRLWGPVGAEPALVSVWRDGRGVWAAVTDLAGLPVPAQPLRLGAQEFTTGPDGRVALGSLPDGAHELRHAQWPGLRARLFMRGGVLFPSSAAPGQAQLEEQISLAPPTPVNVRLGRVAAGLEWWVEAPDGTVLDGRQVEVTVDGAASRVTSKGRTWLPPGARRVSVVDVAAQVAAVAEVQR